MINKTVPISNKYISLETIISNVAQIEQSLSFAMLLRQLKVFLMSEEQFQKYGNRIISQTSPPPLVQLMYWKI